MFELKITRRIPASTETCYRAWTDPKQMIKWMGGVKLIMDANVDGLCFWEHEKTSVNPPKRMPHYGRFLVLEPSKRIVRTWVSPNTHGLESKLEIRFTPTSDGATELVLEHSGLPDDEDGRSHEAGWNYFVDELAKKVAM